jgi:hypothetical protein
MACRYHWGGVQDFLRTDCNNGEPGVNMYWEDNLQCKMKIFGECNIKGCIDTCDDVYQCSGDIDQWQYPVENFTVGEGGYWSANSTVNASVLTDSPNVTCGWGNFNTDWTMACNESNPTFRHEHCTGCYGNAALVFPHGDKHRLIRYPNAWSKHSNEWKETSNYQTFKAASLSLSAIMFGPQPHIFSRYMAAKSDKSLLYAQIPILPAATLLIYSGILFGVVWMGNHGPQFFANDEGELTPESTYPAIIAEGGKVICMRPCLFHL